MENYLILMVMGCIGAVCFAVLFNVRDDKLPLIAASSALSWFAYALCLTFGTNLFWATFWGTVVAGLISEIFARVVKAPVLMLLVPILIPLIPGGTLYNMMSNLVNGFHDAFLHYAQQILIEAGAIALGIICCTSAMSIITGLQLHIHRQKHAKSPGKHIR